MTATTAIRELPPNPSLTQLKKQAKELRRSVAAREDEAIRRVAGSHPSKTVDPAAFTLRDAQVTLAREYGFESWHELSDHVGERMIEERDLHRWFGVRLNNDMWTAIEDDGVGPSTPLLERERLLYSAYASAYHWRNAGNEANYARGEHLISRMAARLGDGELALHHARRCVEIVESSPDVMEAWDLAFAFEALARALAAVGEMGEARMYRDRSAAIAEGLAEAEDREIVEGELARGPWFGLV